MNKASNTRALGLSEQAVGLFDKYCNDLQVDGEGSALPLLARFMIQARRDGFEFDGSHIEIVMPFETWGVDIPNQVTDFVDAMAAMLDELDAENERGPKK